MRIQKNGNEWLIVSIADRYFPVSDADKTKSFRKISKNHSLTSKLPVSATISESILHALTGFFPVSEWSKVHGQGKSLSAVSKTRRLEAEGFRNVEFAYT